jgi:NADH-quinone oxidoreductase subunit M
MGVSSALLVIPALTAVILSLLPAQATRLIQGVALLGSAAACVLSWCLLAAFDPSLVGPQFEERIPWVPEIGVSYHVGIDGLSFAMILLTTLLTLVAVLASINTIKTSQKSYYCWLMILEVAILGVFLAQDWFLFYVFWEVALIPMFFLIGLWGGERRAAASINFFLYTLTGSVLMLIGLLAAYLATPEHSFEMAGMATAQAGWTQEFQVFVFAAVFIGMAVKIPSVPLHGWLPLAHVQAPVPVSMMLSGVLLKMGAYGLFRLLDLAPLGAGWFVPWLFVLGLVSIVYGAFMAWRQDDLKSMVAFSSISHMGFVLVGVASMNVTGFSGAMMQMFTHGIVTAALFMLVGVMYDHTHSRRLSELAGVGRQSPRFTVAMTVTLLAAMGIPGLAGFVSEFHVLIGAYQDWGLWVAVAGLGILVTSAYCLRVFGRVFVGTGAPRTHEMVDLNLRQMIALAPLVILICLTPP